MHTATVNGARLEYDLIGAGEPVVLLHGGLLADENQPLAHEQGLTSRHRVLQYHRRGFAGSSRTGPTSIEQHAADCLELVRTLGLGEVHLVGHSLGGAIALQAALDEPGTVRSLTLLEPALMSQVAKVRGANDPSSVASQQRFAAAFEEVLAIARSGDKRGALLAFLESRAGEAFRDVLDFLTRSGEFDQAVADADTFLQVEMPAAFRWEFTPAAASRIHQPVLSVLGSHSPDRARMVHGVLAQWVPQTRLAVLERAEHALPLLDPPGLASVVVTFLATVGDSVPAQAPVADRSSRPAPVGP